MINESDRHILHTSYLHIAYEVEWMVWFQAGVESMNMPFQETIKQNATGLFHVLVLQVFFSRSISFIYCSLFARPPTPVYT